MQIIGITGTSGAGKGTVVDYIINKLKFNYYSVGDYLIEEIKRRGLDVNRDSQREVANEIRASKGPAFIVQELYKVAESKQKNAIIESIRNPKEAEFIKQHGGILIAVTADQKTRFERIKKRQSEKDNVTFEEFQKQEEKEFQNNDPNAQNLPKCIEMADIVITNNDSLEKLYEEIEKAIK